MNAVEIEEAVSALAEKPFRPVAESRLTGLPDGPDCLLT